MTKDAGEAVIRQANREMNARSAVAAGLRTRGDGGVGAQTGDDENLPDDYAQELHSKTQLANIAIDRRQLV
jgi:hypothetical protein